MRHLLEIRVAGRRIRLFPVRGVLYGILSIGIVLGALAILDRLVLRGLERGGLIAGRMWDEHNERMRHGRRDQDLSHGSYVREWRGRPLTWEKGGRKRILVMGDSFIWGSPYLALRHMWWRQLEEELRHRGYLDVEVVAAGESAWSTHQELDLARAVVPRLDPDLMIWGYVTNDPDERVVTMLHGAQSKGVLPKAVRKLFPNLSWKLQSLKSDKVAQKDAGPEHGYPYTEWELELLKGENWRRYQETVASLGSFQQESGAPAFLLTLPNRPAHDYFAARYAPVLPLWSAAGIPVHDVLDAFVARYGEVPAVGPEALAWGINPGDGHPGPRACRFLAVQAADVLERDHPEVLGERTDPVPPDPLAIDDWLPVRIGLTAEGDGRFRLSYPTDDEGLPVLPLERPAVQLVLEHALELGEVRLAGPGLTRARLWCTFLDPEEGYDECEFRALGERAGAELTWEVPPELAGRKASMLRVQADFGAGERTLELQLVRPGG